MTKWKTTLTIDTLPAMAPFAFDSKDDPPTWASEGAPNDIELKKVVSSVTSNGRLVLLLPVGAQAVFGTGPGKSFKSIRLEVGDEYTMISEELFGGGTVKKSEPWVLHLPVPTKLFGKRGKPMFEDRAKHFDPNDKKMKPTAQIGFLHVDSRRWLVTIHL